MDGIITADNVALFVILGRLLDDNQHENKQKLVNNISSYLNKSADKLGTQTRVYWFALSQQQDNIKPLREKMLHDGWLPDYNDSMTSERQMKNVYLTHGGSAKQWQHLLQLNRQLKNQ